MFVVCVRVVCACVFLSVVGLSVFVIECQYVCVTACGLVLCNMSELAWAGAYLCVHACVCVGAVWFSLFFHDRLFFLSLVP